MALQHLRSSTANKRPLPAGMSDGQLAINTNDGSPGIFFKDSNGALVKVGPVHVGTTAPNASPASGGATGNTKGEQWLDTSGTNPVLKVWDGGAWQSEAGEFVNAAGDVMTGALGIIAGSAGSPGLYFSGDTNTGIYSPGADQVAISTGGSGRLFVDASGLVDVITSGNTGSLRLSNTTTNATAKLGRIIGRPFANADGDFLAFDIRGANSTENGINYGGGSSLLKAVNTHIFYTATDTTTASGTERLRITSAGLVGVGTSSPTSLMTVMGGAIENNRYFWNTVSSAIATSNRGLLFTVDGTDYGRIYSPNGKSVAIQAGAGTLTDAITVEQSGRVGIGTTSPSQPLHVAGFARIGANDTSDAQLEIGAGATGNRNAYIDIVGDTTYTDYALRIIRVAGGANALSQISHRGTGDFSLVANEAASITLNTNSLERARIDSSGRLLVGTSSARSLAAYGSAGLQVESTGYETASISAVNNQNSADGVALMLGKSRGTSIGSNTVVQSGDVLGNVYFQGADGSGMKIGAQIAAFVDGTPGTNDMPGRLVFSVTRDGSASPTEAARINNAGFTKLSNTGIYNSATSSFHEARSDQNAAVLKVTNSATSGYTDAVLVSEFTGYAPNNTTARFLYCGDTASERATIRSNGGLANFQANNVNLSDRNAKKDIAPAAETWDCIKEWEIVNYRYKDQPDDAGLNLGVIAQQVAESCPEVITVYQEAKEATEDQPAQEERLGVKEQQMYWMAIKALQEAQLRIETLEAKVAALESA